MYESRPLSFAFTTTNLIVQSVTTAKVINRVTPVTKPACLIAYGRPMMPAPRIEFAISQSAQ